MTAVYTYSEARGDLATLLEKARCDGEVKIKRRDGQIFVVKPIKKTLSPLAVNGVNLHLTANEIIQFIHKSRKSS